MPMLWSVEDCASAVSYSLHWSGAAYTRAELVRWLGLTAVKGRSPRITLLSRKGLSMTISQSIAVTTVFGLGLAFVPAAWADPASEACAALVETRGALYSMVNAKAVWDQFKATREKEIIPAISKGNADDAKKITNGIQSERLSKMWGIMSCKVR